MRKLFLDFDKIQSKNHFDEIALHLFEYQYQNNSIYKSYCNLLNTDPSKVNNVKEIPFLPINFFKSHDINSSKKPPERCFLSSKTTGEIASKHHVNDLSLYIKSFNKCFSLFYGKIEDYVLLALLPSYLEREDSSLVFMVNHLIKMTKNPESGFYLNNLNELTKKLIELETKGKKTILLGVSFALLNLSENFDWKIPNTIIIETGGMKGMRKELIRSDLHKKLKKAFGVSEIHSEYGMTEILSQAYSHGKGVFKCPPWMQVYIRSVNDPFEKLGFNKTGGINILDLANIDSCAFIETQDLGKLNEDGSFEISGRFDNSEIRGCNLMVL
mgnify:CR=1 FL=1